jgi:hypothetical protein
MVMVAAKVMGAAIRPRPPDVKVFPSFRGVREASEPGILCHKLEIPGSMLRIAPE